MSRTRETYKIDAGAVGCVIESVRECWNNKLSTLNNMEKIASNKYKVLESEQEITVIIDCYSSDDGTTTFRLRVETPTEHRIVPLSMYCLIMELKNIQEQSKILV